MRIGLREDIGKLVFQAACDVIDELKLRPALRIFAIGDRLQFGQRPRLIVLSFCERTSTRDGARPSLSGLYFPKRSVYIFQPSEQGRRAQIDHWKEQRMTMQLISPKSHCGGAVRRPVDKKEKG